jgi:hypothetical protein
MKLKDHIDLAYKGRQVLFAASMGVTHQQVSRWVKYGCIWHDGAVWKRQSNLVADMSLNISMVFSDDPEGKNPIDIKLALVEDQLLMRLPSQDGSKMVIHLVSEVIAKDVTDKTRRTSKDLLNYCHIGLSYEEFLDKYRLYGDAPYNAKNAF